MHRLAMRTRVLSRMPVLWRSRWNSTRRWFQSAARASRWRKLLETGVHSTVADIARAEKINSSYVSRILRLTLLAPEIVEAILDGRQPTELQLGALTKPFPARWQEQQKHIRLIT